MRFEPPVMKLRYGSGSEATTEKRQEHSAQRRGTAPIPDAAEITSRYQQFAGATCIYAAGSLVQGWGHANSDLDLYVISDKPIDLAGSGLEYFERQVSTADPNMIIMLGEFGAFRADIELWRAEQIDEVIGRFTGDTPSQDSGELGRTEQDMLYRLTSGAPLLGEPWWRERRDAVLGSTYGRWLAENRKLSAEGLLEDVGGLLISGDNETAVLAARDALTASVEALLAVHNDLSINRKWLFKRVQQVRPDELSEQEAWSAFTMVGAAEDPADWAERTAALCQRLLLSVEGAK
jgi:hypothetical protein